MTYTDDYGTWKQVGELPLSEKYSFITVPSNPNKIVRFSYLVDWDEWEKNILARSKCLIRWHYGIRREMPGFYSTLLPKTVSNVIEYKLIAPNSFLVPRELEGRLVPLRSRYSYHNVQLLPWVLKIEEYESG